jgi:hypothetical protein
MVRLLLGLIKGAILGAAVGYGGFALGLEGGWNYVTYGLAGFVVGLFVGRPLWSHLLDKSSTVWTPILKGLFGFGIACGIYALWINFAPNPSITLMEETHPLTEWQQIFGGAVGALYGAWLEVDDAPAKGDKSKDKALAKKS